MRDLFVLVSNKDKCENRKVSIIKDSVLLDSIKANSDKKVLDLFTDIIVAEGN